MSKTYRDGSKQIIFATKQLFRQPGWESPVTTSVVSDGPAGEYTPEELEELLEEYSIDALDLARLPAQELTSYQIARLEDMESSKRLENVRRSMRRARVKVRDYALSTDMRWFGTFTLDREKIDRYDISAITKKLNSWLKNQVQRKGLSYVMVPELHQDGAVHFHGLMTDSLDAVDSGTIIPSGEDKPRKPKGDGQRRAWLRDGGRVVYNLPGWPYGFTTALQLEGCYEKAVNYVCKYMSKGLRMEDGIPQKVGGRWYYSGGVLGEPGREYVNIDPDVQLEAFGESAHKVTLDGGLQDVECYVVWITPEGVPK